MVGINSVQKVTRNGNTLVINIPKKIVEIMKLKIDDYIQVSFLEVLGKKEAEERVKRLPEIR